MALLLLVKSTIPFFFFPWLKHETSWKRTRAATKPYAPQNTAVFLSARSQNPKQHFSWQKSSMAISHRIIHVWYIYLLLVDCYGKCRLIYHTWILWVWVCLKIRKPLKSILFLPKQTISGRLGRCLEIFETYVNKIPNTSFSSALKKAASRARIKEGRTACKQTLQSAVHLHAPPSQDLVANEGLFAN